MHSAREKFRGNGFTLLEVLAALAIAATGLLAVSHTVSNSVEVTSATEARTVATWVGANAMAELRSSQIWPTAGNSTHRTTMAGRTWILKRNVQATPDKDIVKVEYKVLLGNELLSTLSGYIARMEPVKQADGTEG